MFCLFFSTTAAVIKAVYTESELVSHRGRFVPLYPPINEGSKHNAYKDVDAGERNVVLGKDAPGMTQTRLSGGSRADDSTPIHSTCPFANNLTPLGYTRVPRILGH